MKKSLWRVLLVLAVCAGLCAALVSVSAADPGPEPVYTIDEPYEYPILPGTDEWKAILDHSEKIKLCQIPEDILPLMTTEALAKTVVTYPFMVDMYAWNSTSIGYDVVALTFNGLQELERRPDGLSALEALRQESARTVDESLTPLYINTIISEMSAGEEPNVSGRATATYVYTPNNHMVLAIEGFTWADHGTNFNEAKQLQNTFINTYSSATVWANVSPVYNCHSFAWYRQSTDNPYWISDPSQYWLDGSYVGTSTWNGSKIFYDNSYVENATGRHPLELAHSAVALSTPGKVRSKWGCNACFEHEFRDCPYYFEGMTTFGQYR